jgi:hypothetical protein
VPGGIELLVLDGGFSENGESFEAQSWLRLPPDARLALVDRMDRAESRLGSGSIR